MANLSFYKNKPCAKYYMVRDTDEYSLYTYEAAFKLVTLSLEQINLVIKTGKFMHITLSTQPLRSGRIWHKVNF